jgi:hypothetical protein
LYLLVTDGEDVATLPAHREDPHYAALRAGNFIEYSKLADA